MGGRSFTAVTLLVGAVATAACGTGAGVAPSDTTRVVAGTGSVNPGTALSGVNGILRPVHEVRSGVSVSLSGVGADAIDPLFQAVFYEYNRLHPQVTVTYSPAGSAVGISDVQQQDVDFGDSEIPMSSSDLTRASGGPVLQIPVALSGVAISYNIPGAPRRLKLDGQILAAIFEGRLTNWDDPAIASVSGVHNLPDLAIVPVHRADSSGPGYDLDRYLIDTAPSWSRAIGTSLPSKSWPIATVGVGEQLDTGVASYISQSEGSIGYVGFGLASIEHFANAALLNPSGRYVAPSSASIEAAGVAAAGLSAASSNVVNERGTETYPLANFSWTLLYQRQRSESRGVALAEVVGYTVTGGQVFAARLGYVPLPASAVALALRTIEELENARGVPLFSY